MKTKTYAFSLLEMMIAVSIILIVCAFGVLNYMRLRANNAVTVSVKIVMSDLKLAKDTASMSSNGADIDVGVPVTGGTALVIQSNGTVVRQDKLPPGVTIQTSWGSAVIDFNQNGSTGSFAASGTITIGHPSASLTQQVQVVPQTGAIVGP